MQISLNAKRALAMFGGLVLALVLSLCLNLGQARAAYAEDYSFSLDRSSCPATLSEGDTFTVSEVLSKDGAESFTMYALSTVVSYDTDMLEVVSAESVSAGVTTVQSLKVVYNQLSSVLAGEVMTSPSTLCTITFKAKATGTTSIVVERVNVSNYTGMRSFPCAVTNLEVNVGSGQAVVEEPGDEGVGEGTTTQEDEGTDSPGAFVDNVRENPETAYDEEFEKADLQRLYDAGMSKADVVALGFTEDEIAKVEAGESITPSFDTREDAGDDEEALVSGESSAASKGSIMPLVIGVVVVVIIVAIVAFAIARRKKNAGGAQ